MKESPILFSDPMVRAILDKTKTQTRRIVKPIIARRLNMFGYKENENYNPPHGDKGDLMWVKECHGFMIGSEEIVYRADGGWAAAPNFRDMLIGKKWKPSIFMKRIYSRITLEHTAEPRIERLQSITPEDARAEGLYRLSKDKGRTWKFGIPDKDGLPGKDDIGDPWCFWDADPVKAYARLWDNINKEPGQRWADNPWVWVYTFKEHKPCNQPKP